MCKKVMIYFVIACFIFSSVPLSLAQESTAGAQEELPLASKEKETAPGNVTIDFKDADIHNVLRILSYKSEVNIVAGKEVEGTVTVRLVDVPWERALDVVLKTYGFAYEREGNIIRVTTVENLGQEPLKTEVFNISYAKAEDVADSIKEIISERGSVRSDKRSNTVIVTDIPTNLYKIQQVIEKLDEATPQVYIEARLIETVLDDDEKLGIDWSVKISAEGSQIPTTLPFAKDLENSDMLRDKFIPVGDPAASDPAFRDTIRPSFPYTLSNAFSFGTLDFTEFQAVLWMLDERTDLLWQNVRFAEKGRCLVTTSLTHSIRRDGVGALMCKR